MHDALVDVSAFVVSSRVQARVRPAQPGVAEGIRPGTAIGAALVGRDYDVALPEGVGGVRGELRNRCPIVVAFFRTVGTRLAML